MDAFRVIGGNALHGDVSISGAKNAVLPALFAAILTDEAIALENVPTLRDIDTAQHALAHVGVRMSRRGHSLILQRTERHNDTIPYDIVKSMRASILALGPLLARDAQAVVSLPGGCAIGARPVDQHLTAFAKMGTSLSVQGGYIHAHCPRGRLCGADIFLKMPSVTATENIMMAATLADGRTIIQNAAREPEIVDLALLLSAMGAKIEGAGESRIIIDGQPALRGASHRVMCDRIELGTYLSLVAAVGGDIRILGLNGRAEALLGAETYNALLATGLRLHEPEAEPTAAQSTQQPALSVSMDSPPNAVSVTTGPFPAYATDMQAQMMACASIARGQSVITENIFENRFMHAAELARMGAKIRLQKNTALVDGVAQLNGAQVMATDLRASASLVIAALAASGESIIQRIYHLDRGYEKMELKLQAIGAQIERFTIE